MLDSTLVCPLDDFLPVVKNLHFNVQVKRSYPFAQILKRQSATNLKATHDRL